VEIDRIPCGRWTEIQDDLDVYGDGAILALRTPGHTPGELSAVVRLPSASYVLTGDTVHDHAQIADGTALASDADPVQSVASIRRLADIARARAATVWVAHDPADWNRFPHAPESIC
jgi:glyoxylase-like metal-dependent hydrolase (beta-lactamase superfamily II)